MTRIIKIWIKLSMIHWVTFVERLQHCGFAGFILADKGRYIRLYIKLCWFADTAIPFNIGMNKFHFAPSDLFSGIVPPVY